MLGNGLYMLGNGLHLLGITLQFGIMSHSGLCRIGDYVAIVAFGIMSIWHYVTFGIMSHSALCRTRNYVVCDCVVRRNVVWPTVGESILSYWLV